MKDLLKIKNEYWHNYYKSNLAPNNPSPFAVECSRYIENNSSILEIGCGNCRDSNYFSKNNSVIAVDLNSNERFCNNNIFFIKSSIENLQDIKCDIIYSRFFLHSIEEKLENIYLQYIERNCNRFFIEARSDKSSFNGDHYRRFINKEKLENKLNKLNFTFNIFESKGFAKLDEEDPFIIRVYGHVNYK